VNMAVENITNFVGNHGKNMNILLGSDAQPA